MTQEQPSRPPRGSRPAFLIGLLAAAAIAVGAVFLPVMGPLLTAAVLAAMLWPLQEWLSKRFRGHRGPAAALLTATVVGVLLGPLAAMAAYLIRDGMAGLEYVEATMATERVAGLLERLPATTRALVVEAVSGLPESLGEVFWQAGPGVGAAAGNAVLAGVFTCIGLYFFLVGGREFVVWLASAAPLADRQAHELLTTFLGASATVIGSGIITAGVQAFAALVGYLVAQVPNPVFFTAVTFIVAFVPAVGATSVCLVAAALLYVTGHPVAAVSLAAWGFFAVGLIDNVVRPLLIRRGMAIHQAVVFFALVGGLSAFGVIGLLLGPMAVALFLSLVRIHTRDFPDGAPEGAPNT